MIPGEIRPAPGDITLNEGREAITLMVANTGDRPVQVGSHYHFFETNAALDFDREAARGMRLDIAAGTAVRFEPGQRREVRLIPLSGKREVWGFNGKVMGPLAVVLALLLAAPEAGAEAHGFAPRDCNAEGLGTEADYAECRALAREEAETQIEAMWAEIMTYAEGNTWGEDLETAQTAWAAFRDADCAVGYRMDAGTGYEEQLLDACIADHTALRIGQLQVYLDMQGL